MGFKIGPRGGNGGAADGWEVLVGQTINPGIIRRERVAALMTTENEAT